MSRTIQVDSPAMLSLLGLPALEFKSLQGHESLGQLFCYTVELQTPDSPALTETVTANLPIKDLVGQEFSVRIALDGKGVLGALAAAGGGPAPGLQMNIVSATGSDGEGGGSRGDGDGGAQGQGTREINGLVTRARFVRSENRRGIYEVVIEPWLVLATRTSDYKIFQNKTPLEIIQEVLADYIYPCESRITHSYPQRVFQVQYGETDFAFISRLMQEFGIYYFWEHQGGSHKLILVDDAGAHRPFESAAYERISFYGESAKLDEEYCSRFDVADTLTPGQWVSDDFDFTKPRARLQSRSRMPRETGHNQQEIYRWPGDYLEPGEGESLVKVRMEEAGAVGKRASGSGNLRAMVAGCTFALEHHPQQSSNREWLIIGATLALQESSHAAGGEGYRCHVEFEVQQANDIYRSPQVHARPHTQGPQTAIVTGPVGQEIWTNEYGQVKVSFHWNRYCSKDENSSCWIRVSSPWAGNGFGGIAVPRIGQEVIVDFENGVPDPAPHHGPGLERHEHAALGYVRTVGAAMLSTVVFGREDIVGHTWSQGVALSCMPAAMHSAAPTPGRWTWARLPRNARPARTQRPRVRATASALPAEPSAWCMRTLSCRPRCPYAGGACTTRG